MIIDPIPLCTLLYSVCSENKASLSILSDARPMPAFVTKPNYENLLSASFNVPKGSVSDLSQIQREARKIVDWFNEKSDYKIKFRTAERLYIKTNEWIHILQVRFHIYEHTSEHAQPCFETTWT